MPRKEVAPINLFDLFAKISLDTSEYDSGVKDVSKSGGSLASKLKSGLASAGKVAAKGIAAIGTAASGAVVGLLALESSTEEYRVAMGKLNTAFEAAGYGAETAQQAYNAFYGILGDTDTATEASQLLAKLADSAEDVSTWTDIAAGVAGTFGDSLPIEGLIEASNETAKVGQVTGVLADALNWAGISEDDFNARLSACSSESERNQLIMDTLSGTYDEASEAFYRNNEALVESRNNQAQLDATLATLGQTVSNVKNRLLSEFLPAISNVATAFSGMLSGTAGADQQFSTAVQGLVNVAVSKLPEFLNMGVQILSSLASGIVQSIPTLVAAVPQIVAEIGAALTELLPQVLDMGVQLLDQFTSGIETGLPDMVSRIPEIITQFLSYITEQLPTILDKGVELLNNLVNGIIGAIPQMVAALPQIITSFAKFIADNLPEIVRAGIDILMNLITGIIKTIPDLVASLPQIINAIIDGIGNLMGGIVDIGKNIVEGIWQGIQDMAVWIKDKVTGFFSGIVDGVKNFLGIRSPSKLFRDEIGRNIGLGVAEGIEDSEDDAVKAANDLAKSVYDKSVDWLDKQTKYQNFSLQQQLEVWEAIQGQFIKESQQYADAEEKIFDLRKQIQEEYYDKVQEITTNISDLEQNYQNELSKRTQEIFNSFGLFDQIPERQKVAGDELLENLSGQIAAMEDFYSGLDELMSRGVGSALVDEIRSMGPDAADELSALLSLSDEKLSEYASLYQEKQELANSIAVNELEELRKETDTQIQKNLQSLEELYNKNAPTVGKAFTDGLSSGIMSGLSSVVNSAVNVAQAAVKATRDALGIHSPSRVFADIGKNMALGLGQGWDNEYDRIRRDIEGGMDFGTASVDFASSGLGVASAGMVNGVSASVQGAGMSGGSITVNLMMPDGTKFASYLLGPLSNYAKANGTPILHPT
ncbi:phage tail protein [Flavonifractor plautii]|uniref:phage tail protein n=1 Tax=Flavonifractor plautii TaxID=292800 RepID=UPI00232E7037|nr:hypothetical protein [Flavonifractor plautii]MDB7955295.1 hypothetical protein [Flavonifractor plautii]